MEHIAISQLNPELRSLESKQFKAVVTLLWPYSSSTRQCALLLAEPDFRLRRRKGQVRVRFSGTSARAVAGTGIGIGDQVVVGLRGVTFVQVDEDIKTPGRSIDWELAFSQTLDVQIFRKGAEIARVDIIDAAPTPAPTSPVRQASPVCQQPADTPFKASIVPLSEKKPWSSPAFLKRTRLSDGPFFEAGYDPLLEAMRDEHQDKRRRRSYRDWKAWSYSARTPSPEKDDMETESGPNELESSPFRQLYLPDTPESPPKPAAVSIATLPHLEASDANSEDEPRDSAITFVDETAPLDDHELGSAAMQETNTFVRDDVYYELYAGPNEVPPPPVQVSEGDIEGNLLGEETPHMGQAMVASRVIDGTFEVAEHEVSELEPFLDQNKTEVAEQSVVFQSSATEDGVVEQESVHRAGSHTDADPEQRREESSSVHGDPNKLDYALEGIMPPPSLPFLQTDFPPVSLAGSLTPIGREPSSPILKPLDSSTLPMPSPFPGDREGDMTSYLDFPSSTEQQTLITYPGHEQGFSSEPNDIAESSFHSSVSSANAPAVHLTHESAFTDIRFTFGMDGSVFSQPKATLQDTLPDHVDTAAQEESQKGTDEESAMQQKIASQSELAQYQTSDALEKSIDHNIDRAADDRLAVHTDEPSSIPVVIPSEPSPLARDAIPEQNDIIVLSSDVGSASEEDEPRSESEDEDEESEEDEAHAELDNVGSEDDEMISELDEDNEDHEVHSDPEMGKAEEQDDYSSSEQGLRHGTNSIPSHFGLNDEQLGPGAIETLSAHSPEVILNQANMDEEGGQEEDQYGPPPIRPKRTASATEIIDLGSGSEDESDEEGSAQERTAILAPNEPEATEASNSADFDSQNDGTQGLGYAQPTVPGPNLYSPGQSLDVYSSMHGYVDEKNSGQSGSSPIGGIQAKQPVNLASHEVASPEAIHDVPTDNDDHSPTFGKQGFYATLKDGPLVGMLQEDQEESPGMVDLHPDIKIESIEEDTSVVLHNEADSEGAERHDESATRPSTELVIAVPEDGTKLGELQLKSVSATGPARNTRSKTKESLSPLKDATPTSRTRVRKSRSSATPTAPATASPYNTRSKTTVSPIREQTPELHYDLRSRASAKTPSPRNSLGEIEPTPDVESPRKSHRKPIASPFSSPFKESWTDSDPSCFEPIPFPNTSFGPSQELGASQQSKYSNVAFVKDSEEGSLRSERSISTNPLSDSHFDQYDYNAQHFANLSEPVHPATQGQNLVSPYPDLALVDGNDNQNIIPSSRAEEESGLPLQPFQESPAEARLGLRSSEMAFSSPQRPQRTRRDVYELSSDAQTTSEAEERSQAKESTPKAQVGSDTVTYPELPRAEEVVHVPSSPPATQDDSNGASVSRWVEQATVLDSFHQHSLVNSNMPITPETTQRTIGDLEPTLNTLALEQTLPMTPQLTQRTLAGLSQSMDAPAEVGAKMEEAYPLGSSSIHTEDLSASDEEADNSTTEPPSVGLSTPISYYTPLKDLTFFMNRSSQHHHSASNPDVLALVTSSTTAAKRADKGPKHYYTTFKITDLSTYPMMTSVQCFRAYSSALPIADAGDIVLLRSFVVKSINRIPALISSDDSAWCVWRYKKPVWGVGRGEFGEVKKREEVTGPSVERGEGERGEVRKLKGWWTGFVRRELEESEAGKDEEEREIEKASSN